MSIFERFTRKNAEADLVKKQRQQKVTEFTAQLLSHVQEAQARFPQAAEAITAFAARIQEAFSRYTNGEACAQSDGSVVPVDGMTVFYMTEDRMDAYACMLPPMDGGKEVVKDSFWEDLRYEGVSFGILEEQVETYVRQRRYLHIFPVAKGVQPQDGTDGRITDLFERRAALRLEADPDTVIDFAQETPIQVVRKGEIICQIQPPQPGREGKDVTGRALPCKDGQNAAVPSGDNTRVSSDGLLLLAGIDGAVSMENEKFSVKQQRVIPGDVDTESIRVSGDIYIGGDVIRGAKVEASGNIIIRGAVRGALIRSTGGSIRIQKGIQGDRTAAVRAAGQIQTPLIEEAQVNAGTDVFAEVVVNSDVISGGTVSVQGGRGLILGGHIKAESRVICKKIGNLSGQRNQITLGYSPKLALDMKQVNSELEEIRSTLEKLRKSVSGLRAAGDLLSLEKRAVLAQLTEQRTLYEDRETALASKQKTLKQTLHAASSGRVICKELYPVTVVQIGDREAEFKSAENNCNIHVYAGQVVVK